MSGASGDQLRQVLGIRTGVRDVYVVPGSVKHYRQIHAGEYDVARAESLVPQVLADPLALYQGNKPSTVVIIGEYDTRHYLVVPIKELPGELWQESLYIAEMKGFRRRGWVQRGLLLKKDQ